MTRATHAVWFDDQCPFCIAQVRRLESLNWLGGLQFCPSSAARPEDLPHSLTREALLEAIHCVARDGRVFRGARCLRFIGLRLPLLVPVALVLWIPGALAAAECGYRWVSRRRFRLSRWLACPAAGSGAGRGGCDRPE